MDKEILHQAVFELIDTANELGNRALSLERAVVIAGDGSFVRARRIAATNWFGMSALTNAGCGLHHILVWADAMGNPEALLEQWFVKWQAQAS